MKKILFLILLAIIIPVGLYASQMSGGGGGGTLSSVNTLFGTTPGANKCYLFNTGGCDTPTGTCTGNLCAVNASANGLSILGDSYAQMFASIMQWSPSGVVVSTGTGYGTPLNITGISDATNSTSTTVCGSSKAVKDAYDKNDMIYSVAGIPISTGTAWSGSAANAATIYGLWSGTKDSSHCLAGDGTMQAIGGGAGANANGYYLVNQSTSAPVNAINLGGLSSGILKQTVSGGVATVSITSNLADVAYLTSSSTLDATKLSGNLPAISGASLTSLPSQVSDTAYDATSWDGVTTIAPSKNAVRDIINSFYSTGSDGNFRLIYSNNTSISPTGTADETYFEANVFKVNQNGTESSVALGPSATQINFSGTLTNGKACTFATGGAMSCNSSYQADLGLIAGTMTDGYYCKYTSSGTLLSCNTQYTVASSVTSGATGTTPSAEDNSTKIATTAYIDSEFVIIGSGLTAGRSYYLAASTGTLTEADATSVSTLPNPAICVATSTTICRRIGKWTTTGLTAGSPYYVPVGGGAVSATKPTGSGNGQQAIGQASSSTVLEIWANRTVIFLN